VDDAELRAEAISRLKKRRDFMSNLGTFLLVNGLLWLIWARLGDGDLGIRDLHARRQDVHAPADHRGRDRAGDGQASNGLT
jgi:hypothetical protein